MIQKTGLTGLIFLRLTAYRLCLIVSLYRLCMQNLILCDKKLKYTIEFKDKICEDSSFDRMISDNKKKKKKNRIGSPCSFSCHIIKYVTSQQNLL